MIRNENRVDLAKTIESEVAETSARAISYEERAGKDRRRNGDHRRDAQACRDKMLEPSSGVGPKRQGNRMAGVDGEPRTCWEGRLVSRWSSPQGSRLESLDFKSSRAQRVVPRTFRCRRRSRQRERSSDLKSQHRPMLGGSRPERCSS